MAMATPSSSREHITVFTPSPASSSLSTMCSTVSGRKTAKVTPAARRLSYMSRAASSR
jgi:hypothetical protein